SYGGTFIGNFVSGVLWDASRTPLSAFAPMIFGAAALAVAGLWLRRAETQA
ncbi:MAG: hypothetical protein JO349_10400, partial [Candidatus Eremiobacteraeota bacterium]|nr:hypothetical protein [Candidatus Eremiobacteraeota bacterium]